MYVACSSMHRSNLAVGLVYIFFSAQSLLFGSHYVKPIWRKGGLWGALGISHMPNTHYRSFKTSTAMVAEVHFDWTAEF